MGMRIFSVAGIETYLNAVYTAGFLLRTHYCYTEVKAKYFCWKLLDSFHLKGPPPCYSFLFLCPWKSRFPYMRGRNATLKLLLQHNFWFFRCESDICSGCEGGFCLHAWMRTWEDEESIPKAYREYFKQLPVARQFSLMCGTSHKNKKMWVVHVTLKTISNWSHSFQAFLNSQCGLRGKSVLGGDSGGHPVQPQHRDSDNFIPVNHL